MGQSQVKAKGFHKIPDRLHPHPGQRFEQGGELQAVGRGLDAAIAASGYREDG